MRLKNLGPLWLLLCAGGLGLYLLRPDLFSADSIGALLGEELYVGLGLYFVLSCLRALLLIPLSPLLVAGILLFPPVPLFIVTMISVVVASILIYVLADKLGFDEYFERKYPQQLANIRHKLARHEWPVLIVWGAAPVLPTDLIVYAGSVLRLGLMKTVLGVTLGETLMCALYIFLGDTGLDALD
ncbi:MAG: VTT domain-containing protein [Pseudomonadales bacterium]|jgi:uncharacterized membrane protein YdjX (TVP38/TMEM64 family)|nr:VTT domain-containing protein [Pseudomonadales bacterium]